MWGRGNRPTTSAAVTFRSSVGWSHRTCRTAVSYQATRSPGCVDRGSVTTMTGQEALAQNALRRAAHQDTPEPMQRRAPPAPNNEAIYVLLGCHLHQLVGWRAYADEGLDVRTCQPIFLQGSARLL